MSITYLACYLILQNVPARTTIPKKVTPSRTSGAPVQRRTTFNSNDTGNSGRGMSLDRSGKPVSANPSPELKKLVGFHQKRIHLPQIKLRNPLMRALCVESRKLNYAVSCYKMISLQLRGNH